MSLPNACPKPAKREKAPRPPKVRKRVKQGPPKVQDRAYLDWVTQQPCVVDLSLRAFLLRGGNPCGCPYPDRKPFEPMHVKTKGSGGADRGNTVCGCQIHHDEQEGDTEGFEKVYGVSLKLEAARLLVRFIEEGND